MAPKATGRAVAAAPPDDVLPVVLPVAFALPEEPADDPLVVVPTILEYKLPATLCSLARLLACAFSEVLSDSDAVAATEVRDAITDDCEALALENMLETFCPEVPRTIPLWPDDEMSGFEVVVEPDGTNGAVSEAVTGVVRTTDEVTIEADVDADAAPSDETTTDEVIVDDNVVSDTTTEEVAAVEDWSRDVEAAVFEISVVGCWAVV
ncbi:hypothetical protein LTR56_000417 [Elasticomyces elasticus]|nr:hypothetical protein LTR56_000417 [Elasticomyces elasticus]KAK3666888.1 hypothetical protein LTR22_002113 [Elasticomyces elasticus]KAK4933411.1 hypothetical protein LTR49_000405 [Elasticomyces elasticus]KAK5755498.1 hypothetical protein LTS12_014366 [Elasticomyces elasticus]